LGVKKIQTSQRNKDIVRLQIVGTWKDREGNATNRGRKKDFTPEAKEMRLLAGGEKGQRKGRAARVGGGEDDS